MDKFKQYLLATAGLVILVGGFTLLGPAVPQGQAVPPAKDVNVVNDANNPVPVIVQNAANNDGVPFEFAGTFSNPVDRGNFPACITPQSVFTVPTGEAFVVTDMLVTTTGAGTPVSTMTIQRDEADLLPSVILSIGNRQFTHAFRTGLRFEEGEALNLAPGGPDCDVPRFMHFLVTGIRTTT